MGGMPLAAVGTLIVMPLVPYLRKCNSLSTLTYCVPYRLQVDLLHQSASRRRVASHDLHTDLNIFLVVWTTYLTFGTR